MTERQEMLKEYYFKVKENSIESFYSCFIGNVIKERSEDDTCDICYNLKLNFQCNEFSRAYTNIEEQRESFMKNIVKEFPSILLMEKD